MSGVSWIWRDTKERMWVGDVNINDPYVAAQIPFRWIVNGKRASRKEIFAEWIAIRHNGMGFKVDEKYFEPYAVLYVPNKDLESGKI